jgi:hypothetical protein
VRRPIGLLALAISLAGQAEAASHGDESSAEVPVPPWGASRVPAWAQSARLRDLDHPLLLAPDGGAARRGSAWMGAHLPLFGARDGPGCRRPWLLVGPQAWVCQDDVDLSEAPPLPARASMVVSSEGLPYRYFFAGPDGSLAYERIEDVDVAVPVMQLEPGFAVAIVEERVLAGQAYGRTRGRLWVPMRDFGPARAFDFQGASFEGDPQELPVAWVVVDAAPVFRRQGNAFLVTGERRARFDRVGWLERVDGWTGGFARIDEARWIRTRDLRHPTLAPPPEGIGRAERWIDIELDSQTLVARQGSRAVFATLVSTGKGKTKGHPFETPKGVHRIWVKLITATMDNLEDEDASRFYRIEDVPWVQYFDRGVGLHAAFWHRSFGRLRSHGCVNLAPLDAERLFHFTGPRMPAGWTAALPTAYDRGTVVRVR